MLRSLGLLLQLVVLVLVTSPGARADDAPPNWAEIDAYVQTEMARSGFPGLAYGVVQDGQLAHAQGFGIADPTGRAVTPQTPFDIGSIGKTFTALAIRQLINAGKIDPNASVQRYLPWFRVADETASAQITIQHLLDHKSGIPRAAGEQPYLLEDRYTLEEIIRQVNTVALVAAPGAQTEYSNINYLTLGLVVEYVTDQPFPHYVQRQIFEPLGMKHSYYDESAAMRNGLATGYVAWYGWRRPFHTPYLSGQTPEGQALSTVEDMARYMLAYLNEDKVGNHSIVMHAGIRDEAAAPHTYYYDVYWNVQPCPCTSVGISHSGGSLNYNADMFLLPGQETGVVVLTNSRNLLDGLLPMVEAWTIAQGIAYRTLGWTLAPAPPLSALQWYLIFDLILGGLLLFALGQLVQLYRRWNDAMTISWRTIFLSIVDLLFGALILIGVPVVLERGWAFVLTVSADLGGGLFVIALLLLIVVGVQMVRFLRAPQAATAQKASALAAHGRMDF